MQKSKTKRRFIIPIVLIALALLALAAYLYMANRPTSNRSNNSTKETVNYDPPTKDDASSVDANKQRIEEQEANQNNNSSSVVRPTITYAGQYDQSFEVGGYVDVFEEGGTCTATFTQGNVKLTKSVTAIRGANSVDCPVMSLSSASFNPKGQYTVTLSYKSDNYTGTSSTKTIEVK